MVSIIKFESLDFTRIVVKFGKKVQDQFSFLPDQNQLGSSLNTVEQLLEATELLLLTYLPIAWSYITKILGASGTLLVSVSKKS